MGFFITPANIQLSIGLIAILLALVIWRNYMLKERRAARAYTYLVILSREGSTEASSNRIALSIDLYAAKQLKQEIALHVNERYRGSLPALMSEAQSKGFRG